MVAFCGFMGPCTGTLFFDVPVPAPIVSTTGAWGPREGSGATAAAAAAAATTAAAAAAATAALEDTQRGHPNKVMQSYRDCN